MWQVLTGGIEERLHGAGHGPSRANTLSRQAGSAALKNLNAWFFPAV